MLKVVVDTNVWISGLILRQGQPAKVINLFRSDAFAVCCSSALLQELHDVLSRPKIAARIHQPDAQQLIDLLQAKAIFVLLAAIPTVCRDPKDDVYLACANAVDADFLITGDQDMLVLKVHGRTAIVTPTRFLSMLLDRQ